MTSDSSQFDIGASSEGAKTPGGVEMTPREMAYLDQLAADIAARGGLLGGDLFEAAAQAHERRMTFAAEILNQNTRRAKCAKVAIRDRVWASANRLDFIARQAFIGPRAAREES